MIGMITFDNIPHPRYINSVAIGEDWLAAYVIHMAGNRGWQLTTDGGGSWVPVEKLPA